MPFWKKSEDPWDRKPEKRRSEPTEPKEPKKTILERLDDRLETLRDEKRKKEEAKVLPPEKCPWCGREMEQGYLCGGKYSICWYPGIYKTAVFIRDTDDYLRVDTEGGVWGRYRVTWLCRECKKLVFDMPEPSEDPWAWAMDRYDNPREAGESKKEDGSGEN